MGFLKHNHAGQENRRRENLERWKASGQPKQWVESHSYSWNHEDWLSLLNSLGNSEYWPMEPDEVGAVLEELKRTRRHEPNKPLFSDYEYGDAFSGSWQACVRAFYCAARTIYRQSRKGGGPGNPGHSEFCVQLFGGQSRGAVVLLHRGTGRPLAAEEIFALLGVNTIEAGFSAARVTGKQRLQSLWSELANTGTPITRFDSRDDKARAMISDDPPPGDLHPRTWDQ